MSWCPPWVLPADRDAASVPKSAASAALVPEAPCESDVASADAPTAPTAARVWSSVPPRPNQRDSYGYGRIPAFWFTLNCPYNYLYEIHRFQGRDDCFHPTSPEARRLRFQWCLDNADLVCFLHVLRVELLVRLLMPAIVPHRPEQPFHYWVRFEEGVGGNPHAHGLNYAAGNPSLSGVRRDMCSADRSEPPAGESADALADTAADLARYFERLACEWHPAKDPAGDQLYDFVIENISDHDGGRLRRSVSGASSSAFWRTRLRISRR